VAGGFGLHPDFAVFADVAEGVGFGVHDGDLGADGDHSGVLDQEGKGVGIGINGEDEAAAEGLRVEVELDGFDAHVGAGGNHGVDDVGIYCVDGSAVESTLSEVYSHFLVWRGDLVRYNSGQNAQLTNVCSRSTISRDHEILQLLQTKAFTGHVLHCMIEHLRRCICVFHFIAG